MNGLPEGWTAVPVQQLLGRTTNVDPGKSPATSFELWSVPSFSERRPETLIGGEIRSAKQVVHEGDVLLCKIVPHINRVWLVEKERGLPQIASGEWIVLRQHGCDANYLRYCLSAPAFREQFLQTVSGVGGSLMRARPSAVAEIEVPIAPLAEQGRVVAKLDALTARTARARADLDRIPALAARYKQAVLAMAFDGQLTADWRRERGEVAFLQSEVDFLHQRRAAYQSGRRGSRLREAPSLMRPGDNPNLPPTWASGCVADVADLRVGYAFKSAWFKNAGVPLIRGANVGVATLALDDLKYLSAEQAREFDEYRLEEGNILLAMDRPIISAGLKIARVTAEEAGALLVQRVASPLLTPLVDADFLWWLFHSQNYLGQIARHATGSDLPHVSGNDILTTPAPLPPPAEQCEIAHRIARSMIEIDRLTVEAAAARRLLDRLDQAVLAKAFRGELVPQDPADEPASVLLQRIRAERAAAPKPKRGRTARAAA